MPRWGNLDHISSVSIFVIFCVNLIFLVICRILIKGSERVNVTHRKIIDTNRNYLRYQLKRKPERKKTDVNVAKF